MRHVPRCPPEVHRATSAEIDALDPQLETIRGDWAIHWDEGRVSAFSIACAFRVIAQCEGCVVPVE